MTQDVPLNFGDPAADRFFDAVQEMMSSAAHGFSLVQTAAAQLQVPAGVGDQQASISIGGLYRWNTAPVTVTVSGAAGQYDIFATTTGPNVYTASTDTSPVGFGLTFTAAGGNPGGRYRKVARVTFDGTNITQITQLVGFPLLAVLQSMLLPAGLGPLPHSGATAPAGWLICDGRAVAQATYPALFAAIGTVYLNDYKAQHGGSNPPAGQFALPDCRGRVMVAPDTMGVGAAGRLTFEGPGFPGVSGGEQAHVLVPFELAAHTHVDQGHSHGVVYTDDGGILPTFNGRAPVDTTGGTTGGTGTAIAHTDTGAFFSGLVTDTGEAQLAATGKSDPHENMPPFLIATTFIIKT